MLSCFGETGNIDGERDPVDLDPVQTLHRLGEDARMPWFGGIYFYLNSAAVGCISI